MKAWHLWLLSALLIEAVISAIGLVVKKELFIDYMLTGTATSVLAASLFVIMVSYYLKKRTRAAQGSDREQIENELWLMKAAIDKSKGAFFRLSSKGVVQYVNDYACESLGYTREELVGMHPWEFDPDFPPEAWGPMWEGLKSNGDVHIETRHRRKDGTLFPVEITGHYISHDGAEFSFTFVQDISERKRADMALRQKERYQRALLDNFPFEVWLKDTESRFLAVNQVFARTFGAKNAEELVGKSDYDIATRGLAEAYRADDRDVLATRQKKTVEEEIEDQGVRKWVETFKAPVVDENGELLGTVGFARDITARKDAEKHVRHLAHFDQLTNLPNRTLLTDRLYQALALARRDKAMLVLMFLDLDRFKPVNDKLGHDVGDLLLKEVATRLMDCVQRESDTVARAGGDEFVILLPHIEKEQDAIIVAEKILHTISQPFAIEQHTITISSSIGIAIYPLHGDEVNLLMKNADKAMYQAKKSGRNCYRFFSTKIKGSR